MKVILTKEVAKLGKAGEVKQVSDGYAINFLLPQNLATAATAEALKGVEQKKESSERAEAGQLKDLARLKKKLENKTLEIKAKVNDKGKLFAQIKAEEIARQISEVYNVEVESGMIGLKDQIKQVGEHKIEINLGVQDKFYINLNLQAEK